MRLVAGGAAGAILAVIALLAVVWTPYPVDTVDVMNRFAGASAAHPLGTDHYGRDVVSMLMVGATTSLGVALGAVLIGIVGGVPLGLAAASVRGWSAAAIMRTNDLVFAFPALITAAILTTLTGPRAVNALIAIGIFNIPVFARLAANSARQILALDYVAVAELSGKGRAWIAAEHVLPNIAPVILTQAATQFAIAVLAEAGLSYVGLGAQPPAVSWGRMLAEAQTMIVLAPQLALWPGLSIAVAVLIASVLGEGLRRQLDPRLVRYAAG